LVAPPKRRSLRRRILLQLALLPLELLAVELGFRGWLRLQGEPYAVWRAEEEIRLALSRATERAPGADLPRTPEVLHPYYGFEVGSLLDEPAERAEYYRSPEARRAYDVMILGGSVAATFAALGAADLAHRLEADPRLAGRPVRIHANGRGSFKQPQQATVLAFHLASGSEPDAVIDLDGFNELAVASENALYRAHPLFPSLPQWGSLASGLRDTPERLELVARSRRNRESAASLASTVLRWRLHASAVIGTLAISRLQERLVETHAAAQEYLLSIAAAGPDAVARGPSFDPADDAVLDVAVRAWSEGSRSIHGMCAVRGIFHLHVLQPALDDAGSKPLTAQEIERGAAPPVWTSAVRRGYPLLREAGRRLAASGIPFFDASRVFSACADDLYLDSCHFNERGNRILAAAIADAFLAALPADVVK